MSDISSDVSQTTSTENQTSDLTTSNKLTESSKPAESSKPTHTHKFSNATCTEPQKCSCGATNGSALGHNYNEGLCSRCGSKDSSYKPNADKIGKFYDEYGKEISWGELAEGCECCYYDENGTQHQFRKIVKDWYSDPDYCYNCGGYVRGTGFFSSQTCTHCKTTFTRSNVEKYHNFCGDCGISMKENGCSNLTVCQTCGEIYKSHTSHTCIKNHPIQY